MASTRSPVNPLHACANHVVIQSVLTGESRCNTTLLAVTQSPPDEKTPPDAAPDEAADEPSPGGKQRKERVLHTRVPAVLEDELKRLATALRMPVSNVVRAILEDAVEAVEVVGERAEGELKGIAHRIAAQRESLRRAVQGEPPAPSPAPRETSSCPASAPSLDGVIGFQRLALATASSCTVCGKALPRGAAACRGIRDDGGPKVLLGGTCSLAPEDA